MKTTIIITFLFIINSLWLFGQIIPDSLSGIYIGKSYWRVNQDPWIVQTDTIIVTSVDTLECMVEYIGWREDGPSTDYLHTTYSFCFGLCNDWCTLFHSGDSIKIIYDDVGPLPGNALTSHRFFGKRTIKLTYNSGILFMNDIMVFPNPVGDQLTIEGQHLVKIEIINPMGQVMKSSITLEIINCIDISDLCKGIYILRIMTTNGDLIRKIIKH